MHNADHPLVLKARHLSGFALEYIGVLEQALEWFPLGLALVMENEPFMSMKYFR